IPPLLFNIYFLNEVGRGKPFIKSAIIISPPFSRIALLTRSLIDIMCRKIRSEAFYEKTIL
ncbi:hypothetical protein, partial [Pedobacter sp. HMWF019]|uniref:hypothetical protein n=1 Tax=Pedobacter sp. HMWF019 TaxID=2056856 RepID=UPI001E63F044